MKCSRLRLYKIHSSWTYHFSFQIFPKIWLSCKENPFSVIWPKETDFSILFLGFFLCYPFWKLLSPNFFFEFFFEKVFLNGNYWEGGLLFNLSMIATINDRTDCTCFCGEKFTSHGIRGEFLKSCRALESISSGFFPNRCSGARSLGCAGKGKDRPDWE